jgi:hypothetical protein
MGAKRQQKGGAFGVGMALGMAIPAVLGTAGKILPGIFGKKGKQSVTNNNNYANHPQLRARPRPQPQYYRPPPQYYRPPPPQRYYYPSRRPPTQPIKRLQKGGHVRPRKKNKKWYRV